MIYAIAGLNPAYGLPHLIYNPPYLAAVRQLALPQVKTNPSSLRSPVRMRARVPGSRIPVINFGNGFLGLAGLRSRPVAAAVFP